MFAWFHWKFNIEIEWWNLVSLMSLIYISWEYNLINKNDDKLILKDWEVILMCWIIDILIGIGLVTLFL